MKVFNFNKFSASTLFGILILSLFASACSNSTSGEEEHHNDPEGFLLKMNGQIVVQQLPNQEITGGFELMPGEETDLITIYFLNDEMEEFQPDEPEYSLGYEFETDGVAEFEQHSEDGRWSFHLHAETEGVTDLELKLMHNDHDDFTSQKIHVHVESAQAKN